IAGNPDFEVDPVTNDFYRRVIDLRSSIKKKMKGASPTERQALHTLQGVWTISVVGLEPVQNVRRRSRIAAHGWRLQVWMIVKRNDVELAQKSSFDDLMPEVVLPTV